MNLADALLLENTSRLALVGAGGKTSAMFAAAKAFIQRRQAPRPILLTTTTHLAIEQCSLADHHFKIHSAEDVNARVSELNSGILLFTGTEEKDGRISGPDPQALEAIHTLADGLDCPLLVEADGSRLHPLKAPADFEPVIPEWVNHVLVCAGLAGLGEPLDAEIVHRPEIYAQLSGLVPGAPITPQAIVRVLRHSSGGLKAIPCHARRSVLLNQADTPEKQAAARRMADQLLGDYERVIISSLNLAVGDPVIHAAITPAAGIVLAAGSSSRYGQVKQLLEWQGESFVHRVSRTALTAGLDPVIVVTGAFADQVTAALTDLPAKCIFNPGWETGQGTSVAAGIQALPPTVGAAVFLLADQPLTPPGLITSLVEAHAIEGNPIIGPLFDGQRGNPVLFDRITFPDLLQLKGDKGGRAIFSRYPVRWIPWQETSGRLDIDTPADYEQMKEQ